VVFDLSRRTSLCLYGNGPGKVQPRSGAATIIFSLQELGHYQIIEIKKKELTSGPILKKENIFINNDLATNKK
jgi:hypothetical protein